LDHPKRSVKYECVLLERNLHVSLLKHFTDSYATGWKILSEIKL